MSKPEYAKFSKDLVTLMYLFNKNHIPNNDPQGFIRSYNACRFLLYPFDSEYICIRDYFPSEAMMKAELATSLQPNRGYYGFVYTSSATPSAMTQQIGVTILNTSSADLNYQMYGISQTMVTEGEWIAPVFDVVQQHSAIDRVDNTDLKVFTLEQYHMSK